MADMEGFQAVPVSWQVEGIEVNATLTVPHGAGPFPAVILVAGSGPTDRNWNSPLIPGDNGSGALLAAALAGAGLVTLRYDKRASGPQAQAYAVRMAGKISMQGHLEELAGGVRLLAGRREVDPGHIFILGHSEGCFHALNYQAQAADRPCAGLILAAPMGRPAGVVARSQIAAQLAPVPGGGQLLEAYDAAMADFAAGRPVSVGDGLPEGLKMLILAVTSPVNQPFSRELWIADPLALLSRVAAPVLILIGKKDIQVDWQADGALFETSARDCGHITIVYPENASHVLKYEPKDRSQFTPGDALASYSAAETTLDPQTVETILSWLRARLATA
jgi:alpha-beta hydrolase superfamily lysophospholipase